jgi:hypothetical protein
MRTRVFLKYREFPGSFDRYREERKFFIRLDESRDQNQEGGKKCFLLSNQNSVE